MSYRLFYEFFPEIAERETRNLTIIEKSPWGLPPGNYALCEMFCDEPGCDCQRVLFFVAFDHTDKMEAVVAYGWETPEFYAKWMGGDGFADIAEEMAGLSLNSGSRQSKLAPAILEMVRDVLTDEAYVERVKKHYQMVRDKVDKMKATPKLKNKSRKRRK